MKKIFTLFAIILIHLGVRAQAWVELGTGPHALNANYSIFALLSDPSGRIYAAGGFTDSATYISGSAYVAVWIDTAWLTLGGDSTGALNANNSIYCLTRDALSGSIYATGNFTDGNGRQYVAKWDGGGWSEVGVDTAGLNATGPIYALTTDLAGNVYAAGSFTDLPFGYGYYYVAEWNGHWSELGLDTTGGLRADSSIYALATGKHGSIYAAGAFTDSLGYNYVAKWNGTNWSEVGNDSSHLNANGSIRTIITDTAGHLYVAGDFTDSLGYYAIEKWNDSVWVELSNPNTNQVNLNGPINALTLDSVGNVYAAGMLSDTSGNFYFVAVWNGSQILTVDNYGTAPLQANDFIYAMASDKYGNVYTAGNFTDANAYKFVAEFTGNIPEGIATVNTDRLHIYPNPASGLINIQADGLSGTAAIQVLDALGRIIYTVSSEGSTISTQIDISGYSPGVYTLLVSDGANTAMAGRIVKE
jgi:hypothetical protein